MKRTPRSASRRASRQLAAKVPGLRDVGAVQVEGVLAARSTGRSARARTSACGRPSRTGRCAWRSRGRRPSSSSSAFSLPRSSSIRRAASRSKPARVREVEHRVADRAELHALVLGRQEAAAPEPVVRAAGRRLPALRDQHDERRQVLVLAAQAVAEPGADARPAGELGAGLEEGDGRVVVDRLGVHRLDEAEVVGDLRGVRQQLADPRARLAVLGELEERRRDRESAPARRSCRSAAGPCGPSRAGRCRATSPAPACSRTGRSATGRRPGTGR